MTIYASTFISGLQEPVKDALLRQIPDAHIINLYDGLIIYGTKARVEKIKKIRFFNNSFLVLKMFKNYNNSLESMIKSVAINKIDDIKPVIYRVLGNRKHSYRIITSKENKLVPVSNNLLKSMERQLSAIPILHVDRLKPEIEFWFLLRREKIGIFMIRLTKKTSTEKRLNKGELRPELCDILCTISEVKKDDIFLDPFCGYGAIPFARETMFKYNTIFAFDNDWEKVWKLKEKIKHNNESESKTSNIIVRQVDALCLSLLEDCSVNKIVTDPPWGLYEDVGMEMEGFYDKMMKEMYRVLKTNGIIVILTANKDELEKVLLNFRNKLKILNKYNILVSGKKAAVYKIIKILLLLLQRKKYIS